MIDYGAFLDSYYAYDSNQPQVSRAYTTQPVKHNKPSINLAHLEMRIQTKKIARALLCRREIQWREMRPLSLEKKSIFKKLT